jgi:hypothetical protein
MVKFPADVMKIKKILHICVKNRKLTMKRAQRNISAVFEVVD